MHAAVVDSYPYPPARAEYRPMSASQAELRDLEAILRSVEAGHERASLYERRLGDALRRAVTLMREQGESRSSVMWVLAALRQSLRKPAAPGHAWFIVDHDLYQWALEQIDDLVGPIDGVAN